MPPPGHGPPPQGPQGPPAPHVNPAFFQQQGGAPPHQPHPQAGPPPSGPPHVPQGHGPPHGYGPPPSSRVNIPYCVQYQYSSELVSRFKYKIFENA